MLGNKFAIGLGLLTCTCLWPATSRADVHLQFGTKWQPLRYTTSAYPFAGGGGKPIGGVSGFQTTSLDPYLAVFFAQKYGISAALDIGYGKFGTDTQAGMTTTSTSDSFFQFGFALGFKWYILQPRAGKVAPLLYADIFKYFSSISTSNMGTTGEQASAAAAMLSPLGGTLSFGAEYFVTPNFSVGSEIFGFKVAGVNSEINTGTTKQSQNYVYMSFYTGITLNYRFQVQASVQSEDEAKGDEETPRKKKRPVKEEGTEDDSTTPPAPPPPTPEAVD